MPYLFQRGAVRLPARDPCLEGLMLSKLTEQVILSTERRWVWNLLADLVGWWTPAAILMEELNH